MFFPNLQVADVARTREFWTALGYSFNETYSAENLPSRDAVDTLVEGVLAGGGAAARPMEDLGFVDTRAFRDLDGHIWEPFFMDAYRFPSA
ncbi:VOC family protein [Serinibacter salmoneus]|uniref:Glyoxalase-like domain-containing protein n=1 Tax=Serinibacter salmoneus TaxID=556530 RepID=A0A2A9CZ35_9MICO|nr:hypothetical protein [Serinibacter salmoneus]PFG18880.1 hypothetical protein ATL40_0430 [Serinibacter salmoneus]